MVDERRGFIALIMQGFTILTGLAIFGMVIATLVITVNIQKNQKKVTVNAPASIYNNTLVSIYNNTLVTVYNDTIVQTINNNTIYVPGSPLPAVYTPDPQQALNIPAAQQPNKGSDKYSDYQSVVKLLKQGLNQAVNPCDDFYSYTCGSFNTLMSFEQSNDNNYRAMVAQMNDLTYRITATLPVNQTIWYFNKCVDYKINKLQYNQNGSQITNIISTIMAGDDFTKNKSLTFPFPMWNQSITVTDFPTPLGMAYLLSKPQGEWGVTTMVSSFVDTNWVNPQGNQGYSMFIDQPTTFLPSTYYVKSPESTRAQLNKEIIETMNLYASTQNRQLNQTILAVSAAALVDFDFMLAIQLSTNDTIRRNFQRSYNQKTIGQLYAMYPAIAWHEYIPTVMLYSNDAQQLLNNVNYPFIVMEPTQLTNFNNALQPNNQYNITPNVILDYVYYSSIRAKKDFLPWNKNNQEHVKLHEWWAEIPKKEHGRRRASSIIPIKERLRWKMTDDIDSNQKACAKETMDYIQYANARIFIDNIYPDQSSRDAIRNNIAKVASSILVGFRSMIDQLNWMSSYTKKGAYNKIENLVKNMAYPDFITNNVSLTDYYAALTIIENDDYYTMNNKANLFNMDLQWNLLVNNASANRQDFNGAPGTTNAWYQPELNSITFPAGILHQPFYDVNWPAAVNFGAMGVIAGHELTHGFDDEGVQWDGVGNLYNWMDNSSQTNFNTMAKCVVDEYSNFCPLNVSLYGAGACVDGAQTQGENIADNGGIHAAFRAYKNYINLNGPDPLLPDGLLSGFTADQLFFLGFAQVWCQIQPSADDMERQILVDPHSPSVYRVIGTIQNFPAFKDAYHCGTSAMSPDTHCNVWVSDVGTSYGMAPKDNSSINVPQAQPAKPGSSQYSNYQSVIQLFQQGMNTNADPCNDFYSYTCGAWNAPMGFDVSDDSNFMAMATQMTNQTYISNTSSSAIKQLITYFNQCVNATQNWNQLIANGQQAINAINSLKNGDTSENGVRQNSTSNTPWPMYDQNSTAQIVLPDSVTMGFLLGNPGGTYGISTLVSAYVDTNWADPQGPRGYSYYIDQPSTLLPYTYYVKAWGQYGPRLKNTIINTMNRYASINNKTLDQTQLAKDAQDLVDFDYMLAMNFSTSDDVRRNSARSYNPTTIDVLNATYPFIFWHEFIPLTMLPSSDAMHATLHNGSYTFIVMEPDMLKKLNDVILDPNNQYKITPTKILNYIYYQQLSSQSQYLPQQPKDEDYEKSMDFYQNHMTRPSMGKKKRRTPGIPSKRKVEKKQRDNINDAQYNCAIETVEMLQYANARVFIDNVYPDQPSRDAIRNNVAKVASSILVGFRSMIDQLNWMSSYTKKGAYSKIENLVKNVAYPDWITDNTQLDNYHSTLNINEMDDYFTVLNKATIFNIYQQFELLAHNGSANRIDFNGPPGITNAWYQPELNSITFPAGILHQPFYDVNWPAAVNFGAMGVIAGHELTHGFDDEGVQWDGVGNLRSWMDASSQANFTNMAKCVVDEYSSFCPLNASVYGAGACLDGTQTQGENIADNGGIHAAFRAYKNYINLNGPDPQLPDGIMGTFTADQLFFLGFAQVWCQMAPDDEAEQRQILVDPHSPSLYRVLGTIQNFPAFKDAFHCPNSVYAPDNHCNVWVSDVSSSYGLPDVKQSDINIPEQPQASLNNPDMFNAYNQSVNFFQASVNFSADPCNDFWSYSCGKYDKLVSFHYADAANLVLMAQQLTDPNYQATIINSTALTKEKTFFDACVTLTGDATANNNSLVQQNIMMQKVDQLKGFLGGAKFTTVYGGNTAVLPNATNLATALGWLSFSQGIDTFVTPMVDTYWVNASRGYQFFVDQNTAQKSKTYYQPAAWSNTSPAYINSTVATLQRFCKEENLTDCDYNTLLPKVKKILDFEQTVAYNYSTDDTTRRQYKRSWNLQNFTSMNEQYGFIDWNVYVNQAPSVARSILTNPEYMPVVMEQTMIAKLSDDILSGSLFDPDTIVNYLYIRLVLDTAQYLPTYNNIVKSSLMQEEKEGEPILGKKRRRSLPRRRLVSITDTQTSCISMANDLMQFANGRVFIDYLYPTKSSRDYIRQKAGGVITNIINSFQGMLEQLDWMTADDKTRALQKTIGIQQNIAYPDWITTPALDEYYQPLNFTADDNYYTMWDKLIQFNLYLQYKQLNATETDRTDFLGQPGTVNAWYQPELNSITFPAGILRPPYYNSLWPASVNYGGLGVVAGHELTHGFDDEGVQWGPTGDLNTWMMNSTGFDNMAQCVVDEYSNFCPLNAAMYAPNCVNGYQTQGENIADNGGIHSAFRAYRTHIALNGPDPMLPDQLFGQFTHDQLFFLSFAQVWCEAYRGDDGMYRQLMVDPHSPSKYRVFGTIQNYPAFQTAYNCPSNSQYAPSQHCRVWVPNVEN